MYDLLRLFASPTFLEGFITIMTTNYLQEIQEFSPELIREGRVGKMIEFKQITEKEAAKMFRRITSPNDENLSPELGAKFRKLFRVKKITHSAVKHYLLKRKNDSRSAYNNAGRWLEDRLAEEVKGDGIQRTTRANEVVSEVLSESEGGYEVVDESRVVTEVMAGRTEVVDEVVSENEIVCESIGVCEVVGEVTQPKDVRIWWQI